MYGLRGGNPVPPIMAPGVQGRNNGGAFLQILERFKPAQQSCFADTGLERREKIFEREQRAGK